MQRHDREGLILKRSRLIARISSGALALLVVAGCATRAPEPEIPLESYLLPGYSTWFAADVAGNVDLYSYLAAELQPGIQGPVERMRRIAGGLRLIPGEPPELSAVASGAFPRTGVRFALTTSRDFERTTAEVDGERAVYYRQREGLLQLAVPADDILYLSTGILLEMLPSRPPADLEIERDIYEALRAVGSPGAPDALLIFDDPAAGFLGSLGVEAPMLPITRIDLSITVDRAGDESTAGAEASGVDFGGVLHLRSEREAALFGRVGRFFVIILVRALGLDGPAVQESVEITVEENLVRFTGIPISREELVDVLRSFGPEGEGP
jgi:hypothetical protein